MALHCEAGTACAARRDVRRRRRELRGLLRERDGHGRVPLRRAGRRDSRPAPRAQRARVARVRSRPASGAALRLSRARALRARHGLRFNANKLLVDPYAHAVEGKIDYREPVFGYAGSPQKGLAGTKDAARRSHRRSPRQRARRSEGDRERLCASTGKATVYPRVPWADTVLYEAHVKGMTMRSSRRARGHPRHLPRARASRRSSSISSASASRPIELLPIHEHMDEWSVAARGHDELLGLLDARVPRAESALRLEARRADRRVQDDGEGASSRRHRGGARRRLQPHGRRRSPRPDGVPARARQLRRTTASSSTTARSTTTSPAAATASTCCTRRRSSSSWTASATG